jgi:hypothetical protein
MPDLEERSALVCRHGFASREPEFLAIHVVVPFVPFYVLFVLPPLQARLASSFL